MKGRVVVFFLLNANEGVCETTTSLMLSRTEESKALADTIIDVQTPKQCTWSFRMLQASLQVKNKMLVYKCHDTKFTARGEDKLYRKNPQ